MAGCTCEVCRSTDKHDKRLRSSVMVEHFPNGGDYGVQPASRIIIDAGPDFRYQMLRQDVRWIDAILLTHEHKDHIGGLDDVRAYNYFQEKAIPVYASERTAKVVRKDFDYAFSQPHYPGVPEIDLRIIEPDKPFIVAGMEVIPVQGLHMKLPVLGFRIGGFVYLTDFNQIVDAELEKIKGAEALVINALRHEKHISHFTVREAIDVSRLAGARQTWFTHMSHQIGFHREVERELPEGIHLGYDKLTIELD